MVEINGLPRIKLSQDVAKITMPGKKTAYRLYGADGMDSKRSRPIFKNLFSIYFFDFLGHALIDLLQKCGEEPPKVGEKVLCRHPFQESKRAYVIPAKVEPLYRVNKLLKSIVDLLILEMYVNFYFNLGVVEGWAHRASAPETGRSQAESTRVFGHFTKRSQEEPESHPLQGIHFFKILIALWVAKIP